MKPGVTLQFCGLSVQYMNYSAASRCLPEVKYNVYHKAILVYRICNQVIKAKA